MQMSARISEKKWDGDGVPLAESNCAGIGSAEDKAARKAAAQTEEAWKGVGEKVGVKVWRIEQFKVVPWPEEEYGTFYSGDSYIILETTKEPDSPKLNHHIYFWLGKDTSIDEMGTAAYKTVELDDLMDGQPTQSREVQDHESSAFRACFKSIHYQDGGVATGFRSAGAEAYEARLFEVRKTEHDGMKIIQVPRGRDSLNEGDCFVLDAGLTIYVWCGKESNAAEKLLANEHAEKVEGTRNGKAKVTHDVDEKFWELLGGEGEIKPASAGKDDIVEASGPCDLFKLTDTSGALKCESVASGNLTLDMLDTKCVMLLDIGSEICLWVGAQADEVERRNAMPTAANFLRTNQKPIHTPIHMYREGHPIKNIAWKKAFSGVAKKPSEPKVEEKKPEPAPKAEEQPAVEEKKSEPKVEEKKPEPEPKVEQKKSEPKEEPPKPTAAAVDVAKAAAVSATEKAEQEKPAGGSAGILTYEELQDQAVWRAKGVDPRAREQHLSDAEFSSLFGMTKAEFSVLPKWKADGLKKKNNLF